MVGNDIFDLTFVDTPAYQHVRHLEQVCTPAESRAVRDSEEPSRSLAVVWASKEAAYKLFSRQFSLGSFVPRQFVIQSEDEAPLDSLAEVRVKHAGIPAIVAISRTSQWVHAIAALSPGQVVRWTVQNIGRGSRDLVTAKNESAAVRSLARQLLLICGFEDAELEFVGRVPNVTRKNRICTEIGISLSHHGKYASAAIAWPAEHGSALLPLNHSFLEVSSREAACSTCTV